MGIRPIVSSCESPTENISQFLDFWLKPLMKALPSYLKDTTQFIKEIKNIQIEPNTLLVTIDVKSLYTSIPPSDGIKACLEALHSSVDSFPDRPDPSVLSCLLEVVLKNNIFEFDGKVFKQLQGTAMGTKLAPAYANIFMGALENSILSHAPLKPSYYRRFIDDIFVLWPHSEADLKIFLLHMNSFHPSIKFTSEFDINRITFLDVNVYKGPNSLSTKKLDIETHIKPTNKQAYIHAKSHHPPGASKGLAIGEMKRYLRMNSRIETFNHFNAKLKANLKRRGYSNRLINSYTDKVKFLDRSYELKQKTKKNFNELSLITRFTPSASTALKIILKKHWPSLQELNFFRNISLPPPMLVYKTNKNIKTSLVRARLPSNNGDRDTDSPMDLALEYTPIFNTTFTED